MCHVTKVDMMRTHTSECGTRWLKGINSSTFTGGHFMHSSMVGVSKEGYFTNSFTRDCTMEPYSDSGTSPEWTTWQCPSMALTQAAAITPNVGDLCLPELQQMTTTRSLVTI